MSYRKREEARHMKTAEEQSERLLVCYEEKILPVPKTEAEGEKQK